MAEEEALLLDRYARGQDADAFRALVEAHQHMVFAVCHRVLHNRADAEDAAQECFFRLAQKAGQLTAPIAGWLHTVAVQRAIDMLRRRVARRTHEAKAAARPAEEAPSWEDIRGNVDEAIAALPERLRVPVVLYYLEGRTQEDIARELGVSQPAVSGRLKRAVAALRKRLEESGVGLSAGVLAPLLSANAVEMAPATLSAALGKMALAGVGGGAAAGMTAAKAAALLGVSVGAALGIAWLAVWALLTGLSGRTNGPGYASAAVPSPAGQRPGPVVERVVGGHADGTDMFIDLDTGELRPMPERVAEVPAMLGWMRRTGADALYSKMMDARALIGADLAAVRLPDRVWQEVEGGGHVSAPSPAGTAFPVYLKAGRSGTVTYCVRTREGATVLLQVVGVEDGAEGGVRIRCMGLSAVADLPGGP